METFSLEMLSERFGVIEAGVGGVLPPWSKKRPGDRALGSPDRAGSGMEISIQEESHRGGRRPGERG